MPNDMRHDIVAAPPHSIEAEQQLLGAMLLDPDLIPPLSGLSPLAFYESAHGDLFKAMKARHESDNLVSPITMGEFARQHAGMQDLGGPRYLVNLAASAVASYAAADYAEMISELHDKRRVMALLSEAAAEVAQDAVKTADVSARVQTMLSSMMTANRSGPVSMAQATDKAVRLAIEAKTTGKVAGIASGIPSLDELIGAFRPADLVIIGGRPSMGKTAVALSMALNAARSGAGVAIASLEMTPESLALRAISEATGGNAGGAIPYVGIGRGEFADSQRPAISRAAAEVAALPISILPMHFRDVAAIQAGVAQAAATTLRKSGLGLVIVDYLQIVQMAGASRYEKVTEISVALKAMAARLQVPVIVLAQLNRGVEQREDKRPMMSDLKESGQLEQDADTVIFCYRDEYYLERMKPEPDDSPEDHDEWRRLMERSRNRLDLIVAKQRQGPIGSVRVGFNPALNYIWEGHGV